MQVPDVYGCVQNETNRSSDALLPPIAERKIDEIFDIVEGRVTAITIETREVQVDADRPGQLPRNPGAYDSVIIFTSSRNKICSLQSGTKPDPPRRPQYLRKACAEFRTITVQHTIRQVLDFVIKYRCKNTTVVAIEGKSQGKLLVLKRVADARRILRVTKPFSGLRLTENVT